MFDLFILFGLFAVGDSAPYEELVRDNKRKEDELRVLHGRFLFSLCFYYLGKY